MKKILTIPASWIYSMIVGIRHVLFNWGVLKTTEFDIPIVCVGNLTVGGTGKTPHTEYLIQVLSQNYNVGILSRGYKRKTRGFVIAETRTSYKKVGDEPKQIKLKFPEIPVAVCEKRVKGIKMLREAHPEINLIILDDAFQHRYVEPWVNIVLMDYNHPIYEDHMLPWGRLRDHKKQISRAQIVITTKCPETLRPLDYRIVRKYLDLYSYQTLYFTHFKSEIPTPLFPNLNPAPVRPGQSVIAMAGIANPSGFIEQLESKYNVVHKLSFKDHHIYKMHDIHHIETLLTNMPEDTAIVMTEKDAVKLMNSRKISENIRRRLHYVSISVVFDNDCAETFNNQINQYVEKNQKYSITHPV